MEENSPSAFKATLLYGLLLGAALVVLQLVLFLIDMHKDTAATYIFLVFMLTGVVLAILDYRNKKLNGFISYGKSVKIGFLTMFFASILVAVYTYLFYTAISPGDLQEIRLEQAQNVYNQNLDPDAEAQAIKWQNYFISPVVLSFSMILYYAVVGILMSLFASIFLKKEEKVTL